MSHCQHPWLRQLRLVVDSIAVTGMGSRVLWRKTMPPTDDELLSPRDQISRVNDSTTSLNSPLTLGQRLSLVLVARV